jgi:hypothetical protein
MCSNVEAGDFKRMVYSILLKVGKSMWKMTETLWKSSLIIAKEV